MGSPPQPWNSLCPNPKLFEPTRKEGRMPNAHEEGPTLISTTHCLIASQECSVSCVSCGAQLDKFTPSLPPKLSSHHQAPLEFLLFLEGRDFWYIF
ncbi:hypothetical protein M758_4G047900 [Ceratodon purpureus]|nr:hypothetical protein M758_4G047900 [Ceratodon purpureus]